MQLPKTNSFAQRGIGFWLLLALAVVTVDQATKLAIVQTYQLGQGTPYTSFFNLVRVHNEGAAFSFLANAGGWQRYFFTAVAVVASGLMLWMLRDNLKVGGTPWLSLALALVLGGAVGNAIDRVAYGYVVDFLDFHFAGIHFPAFNVADSAISVGAVLLILSEFVKIKSN